MFLVYCARGKRDYLGKDYVHPFARKRWEFQFILRGTCVRLNRGNDTIPEEIITGPTATLSGPDNVHGWSGLPKKKCTVLVFHFDEMEYNLRHVIGNEGYRAIRFPAEHIPKLLALHTRCLKAKATPSYFSLTIYHIVSLELALFFGGLIPRSDLATRTDFGENKVREALAWYQANMMLGPNIETVAKALHISSPHLRRLFHQVRNMSPQTAFTQLQFERGKELMLDKGTLLERIAESSGFGSASSFSRAFKKEFGSSPQSYRSELLAGHHAS